MEHLSTWFPFELSPFQTKAIKGIVEGNHVLVTAHTGSGKTVPAEFAIKYFCSGGTASGPVKKKVIYLSPIKALSNQKFYEFRRKYSPEITIGLLTGDIKVAVLSDVLIMTTEILLNYLLYGKNDAGGAGGAGGGSAAGWNFDLELDIENEVGAIVIDEVHYINDEYRGTVYEHLIQKVPSHIQLIMLSATLENPQKFAHWVESRHCRHLCTSNKKVVICSTNHRIVPLKHYAYITFSESQMKKITKEDKSKAEWIRKSGDVDGGGSGGGLYVLQDAVHGFHEAEYKNLRNVLYGNGGKTSVRNLLGTNLSPQMVLNKLSGQLVQQQMLPALCFVFSRMKCEEYASKITTNLLEDDSKIPYTTAYECEQILRRSNIPNYHEYLELDEYRKLVALLSKGVAYHHAGMLPILREMVEFRIAEKKIYLLFATESFAIGLDCPIKTTIFTQLHKFDGEHIRYLYPHEYNQMAGRAGRRGMDTEGHVIHCNNLFRTDEVGSIISSSHCRDVPFTLPDISEYKRILFGQPQRLVSKYSISYSSIMQGNDLNVIVDDAEHSMMGNEIRERVCQMEKRCDDEDEHEHDATTYSKEILEEIEEYNGLWQERNHAVNKRRRIIEERLAAIVSKYDGGETFIQNVQKDLQKKREMEIQKEEIRCQKEYFINQIDRMRNVLQKRGFEKGSLRTEIACRICEIHGFVMMEWMERTDYFHDLSVEDCIALFALFTTECSSMEGSSSGSSRLDPCPLAREKYLRESLLEPISLIKSLWHEWEDLETEWNVPSSLGDHLFKYQLTNLCYEWVLVNDIESCKEFLQIHLLSSGYSIGDFAKAIIKVSNIGREIGRVLENTTMMMKNAPENNHLEDSDIYTKILVFLAKLQQVDGKLLKFVVTMQSLYAS